MKIILISNSFWNFYNFRNELIEILIKNKHQVILAAPYDTFEKKYNDIKKYNIPLTPRNLSIFNNLFLIIYICYIFIFNRPNLVINFTIKPIIFSGLLSRILNINCIQSITGLGDLFLKKRYYSNFIKFIYFLSLDKKKYCTVQNEFDRRFILKYSNINKNNIVLIPGSGVNKNIFKYNDLLDNNKFLITFIGRILVEKGIFEFINSIIVYKKKSNKLKFCVCGSLDNLDEKNKIKFLNLVKKNNINYVGNKDKKEVINLISESYFIILPSYSEGCPKILLEAGLIGRPIITSDHPGCKALINNNNGFIVKRKSVNELVELYHKISNMNFKEIKKMGLNNRKNIDLNFTHELVVNKYLELIKIIE